MVLANYARGNADRLAWLAVTDKLLAQLRIFNGRDPDLATDPNRITNRTRDALVAISPALERAVGDRLGHAGVRDLPARYPTPYRAASRWPGPHPETHCPSIAATGPQGAEAVFDALDAQIVTLPAEDTWGEVIIELVGDLDHIHTRRAYWKARAYYWYGQAMRWKARAMYWRGQAMYWKGRAEYWEGRTAQLGMSTRSWKAPRPTRLGGGFAGGLVMGQFSGGGTPLGWCPLGSYDEGGCHWGGSMRQPTSCGERCSAISIVALVAVGPSIAVVTSRREMSFLGAAMKPPTDAPKDSWAAF